MPTPGCCVRRGLSRRRSRSDARRSRPDRTGLMDKPILDETIETIEEILGAELNRLTVERAVVGVFFTGVKLSNGIAGACATPIETVRETFCCASAVAGGRSPGSIRGSSALALAHEALARADSAAGSASPRLMRSPI